MLFGVSFLTSFLLLAGCRTIHAPSSPFEIWKTPAWEKPSRNSDPVWRAVRKRSIDATRPITLSEFAQFAIANNPSTRGAWETARAFESQKRVQEAALLPTLTGTMEASQTKKISSNKVLYNLNQLQYGPGATLSYLVFDMGGRSARIKGAYFDLLNSNHAYNKAVQDLILNVGEKYYALYSAQATLGASEIDVKDASLSLLAAQKKFDAGLVSKLDVYQAESKYYQKVYSLQSAQGDLKAKKGDLANILGVSADTDFIIAMPNRKIPTALSRRDVSKLIEQSLLFRPDVQSARANYKSKLEAVKAAESDVFPTINAEASANKNAYYFYNNSKQWGDDYSYSAFDVKLSWDVFDGYAKVNTWKKAERLAAAERTNLEQTELAASNDVWTKYFNFRTAIKNIKASQAYLKASQGSYDLALEGYYAGLKSMLDVTDAEDTLSSARSNSIQAERDLLFALIELVHSLGILYPGLAMGEVR